MGFPWEVEYRLTPSCPVRPGASAGPEPASWGSPATPLVGFKAGKVGPDGPKPEPRERA